MRIEAEDRVQQPPLRLGGIDYQGARLEGRGLPAVAPHVDDTRGFDHRLGDRQLEPLAAQQLDETGLLRPVRRRGQEECPGRRSLAGDRPPPIGEVVAQDLAAVVREAGQVGHAAHDVVVDRLAIGQCPAGGLLDRGRVDGRLLVENADRADHARPGVGVARVPLLVPLAGVVAPAVAVEGGRLVPGEASPPFEGPLRQVNVDRLAGWVEQVGVEAAHLVGVDHQVRVPGEDRLGATPRLGVHLHEPVAVEVKQIVVAAAGRPQPAVLHRLVVGVLDLALERLELREVALTPVRVHERVDVNDEPLAQGPRRGVGSGRELVGHLHGRVGARELVAVDRVGHPRHPRKRLDDSVGLGGVSQGAGVGKLGVVGLDRLQARGWRGW